MERPPSPSLFISHLATRIADILFPPWCLNCGEPGRWLCDGCDQECVLLPLGWCGSCGRRAPSQTTLCRRCTEPLRLTRLVSGLAYAGPAERLIQTVKYRPARVGLMAILNDRIRGQLTTNMPPHALLIPIPMRPARESRRGFNQAQVIAELIAVPGQRLAIKLSRTRNVPAQVGLGRAERTANMRDVFRWTGASLAGQAVCLVDDVLTTGATLADAARALRAAGARTVSAITLAQTPPNRPN